MGTLTLNRGGLKIEVPEDSTIERMKEELGIPSETLIVSPRTGRPILNEKERVSEHFSGGEKIVEVPRFEYFERCE